MLLEQLLPQSGPFATVVLSAAGSVDDAEVPLGIAWRNAMRALGDAGLDDDDVARLDRAMDAADLRSNAPLVFLQSAGSESFVERLDDAVGESLAVVDRLPRLGPVLESRQGSIPHVVVVTDRTGADIIGFGTDTEPKTVAVDGETQHIHRGNAGGWSQRRFQQRAENLWEANASDVAGEVAKMAHRIGARVVAIAGDVRAVGFVVEHLPNDLADTVRILEGQSTELIAAETVRAVAGLAARDTVEVIERFREGLAHGRSADGPDATLDALTEGRVEILLVHDDATDDRRARFDPEGLACSARTGSSETGQATTDEGRLVDVAIRAAMLSDATVRFVPGHGGPADGVGAILRW